jgi:hypothetical protein
MIRSMQARDDQPRRLFIVRMSDPGSAGAIRGHVRDGVTGAYRAFSTWPELTSFLADQLATESTTEEKP